MTNTFRVAEVCGIIKVSGRKPNMKDIWERVEDLEVLEDSLEEKSEFLDKLIPLIIEYNKLRDEEWDFEEKHPHRDFWDSEVIEAHDKLLNEIMEKRGEVQSLLRTITGDNGLKF